MILSLQGCMAVGKTTAARYLEQHCQQVQVCFEDNAAVLAEIKQRGLNKNSYADYLEIQRLFLRNELRRGQKAKKYPHAVMDFGAEEIEFYTLNYPKSRGLEWEMEAIRQALAPELAAVQACMPEHILFLDASEAVLRARKAGDTTPFPGILCVLPEPSSAAETGMVPGKEKRNISFYRRADRSAGGGEGKTLV